MRTIARRARALAALLLAAAMLAGAACAEKEDAMDRSDMPVEIRVNQVGFRPGDVKTAVLDDAAAAIDDSIIDDWIIPLTEWNPEIVHATGPYTTSEGCLSLPGVRETTRFQRILVSYEDTLMRSCERSFKGFVAQAVQHEIDHCNGVLI